MTADAVKAVEVHSATSWHEYAKHAAVNLHTHGLAWASQHEHAMPCTCMDMVPIMTLSCVGMS